MVFNDTSTNLGIIQACEDYCGLGITGISGDTNKLKEFTRYANRSSRKIWHTIFMSQGLWQYDDGNETDLPKSTANLVSGTGKYALPSDALTVRYVKIKNSDGTWTDLKQIREKELISPVEEYYADSGTPDTYTLLGNTIELFPAPNYNSTGGLKVYFDRDSVDFANSDTTKTPGFASPYHDLVAIGASMEWLKAKRPDSKTLNELKQDWILGMREVTDFYSTRNKDENTRITTSKRLYR